MLSDFTLLEKVGGWEPWTVQRATIDGSSFKIKLKNDEGPPLCCGKQMLLVQSRKRIGRDMPILDFGVELSFIQKSFSCKQCSKSFTQDIPWYDIENECTLRCVNHKQSSMPVEKAMVVLQEERRLLFGGPMVVLKWQMESFCEVVYCSPNILDVLAYNPMDFYLDNIAFEAIIHSQDQFRVTSKMKAMFEKKDPEPFVEVFRLSNAHGEWRWIEMHLVLDARTKGGNRVITGYLLDITKTKSVEEELRASRNSLQMVLGSTHTGCWSVDLNTMQLKRDLDWANSLNIKSFDSNLASATEVIHPDDRQYIKGQIELCIKGLLEIVEVECRLKTNAGAWLWVSVVAMVSKVRGDGSPRIFSGVVTDISKGKEANAIMLSEKKRYDAIFNLVQSPVMLVDAQDSMIIDVNPATCKLIGRHRSELIGRIAYDYIFPASNFKCDLEEKVSYDANKAELVHADGTLIPTERTYSFIDIDEKLHCLLNFVDISKEKSMDMSLERTLKFKEKLINEQRLASIEIEKLKKDIEKLQQNSS
ncbi:MAG: PAS domain S-box protein [Fibrobacter sp.]|nr:PAS domain S-box protein [Fibrobacter sp.]